MKKTTLSLLLFFVTSTVFCQTFMQGAGVNMLIITPDGGNTSYGQGFVYSPRLNVVENDNLSVSIGIPMSLAFSYSLSDYSNGYDQNSSVGVLVNIPLLVNLNMGRGSTKENTSKIGYFIGAGGGFHHSDLLIDSYYDVITVSNNTFGIDANAGLRIGVGQKYRNIEILFSYMKGLGNYKPNIYSLAALFNF